MFRFHSRVYLIIMLIFIPVSCTPVKEESDSQLNENRLSSSQIEAEVLSLLIWGLILEILSYSSAREKGI